MPDFKATILLGGKTTKVRLSAPDRAEAMRQLRRRGKVVSLSRAGFLDIAPGLSEAERFVFLIKLATMVGARVSMGRALELMAETFTGNIRRVARSMSDRVSGGMNFITAMEAEGKSFPPTLVALVRAGFAAGNAANALREAAEFEQMMRSIRKGSMREIWTGIGYFIAAAALTWATMVWFGPMVTSNEMFRTPGVSVDVIERAGWIFFYINMGLLGVILFLAFFGTLGRLIHPAVVDGIIARIPYYSDLILARNNYMTFYKMGLLIRSGIRVEEALDLVGHDAPRGAIRRDFLAALEAVRKGRPWPAAMVSLDPTDRASLMASSDREDVARTFRIMADQFRDLYIARIQALAPSLNVLAALFMSIASALLFGLTILPMLQLAANIQ